MAFPVLTNAFQLRLDIAMLFSLCGCTPCPPTSPCPTLSAHTDSINDTSQKAVMKTAKSCQFSVLITLPFPRLYICISVYLCVRTYHVCDNYVTYIVAMRPYFSRPRQLRRLLCVAAKIRVVYHSYDS